MSMQLLEVLWRAARRLDPTHDAGQGRGGGHSAPVQRQTARALPIREFSYSGSALPLLELLQYPADSYCYATLATLCLSASQRRKGHSCTAVPVLADALYCEIKNY